VCTCVYNMSIGRDYGMCLCEVVTVTNPCRAPLYSCRNNIRCVLMDWVLDGKDDCLDGSDEGEDFTHSHCGRLRLLTAVDGRNAPSTAVDRDRTRATLGTTSKNPGSLDFSIAFSLTPSTAVDGELRSSMAVTRRKRPQ